MREKFRYDYYINLRNHYERVVNILSNIRLFMFLVMLFSFILKYYYYPVIFGSVFVLSLISFILVVIVHNKYFKIMNYYSKYVLVLDTYLARENGDWKCFSDKGIDFLDDDKSYLRDLDILGDVSLFQYLSVCKTEGGREKLAFSLDNLELDSDELEFRQGLIKELVLDKDFVVKFQVGLSDYEGKGIHLSREISKFKEGIGNCFFELVTLVAFSFICVFLLVCGCLGVISLNYFYGMFCFNLGISYMYAYIYRNEFRNIDRFVRDYGGLVELFSLFNNYSVSGEYMGKILKEIRVGMDSINRLNNLDSINSLRSNFLSSFIFNGIGNLNLLVMYKYSLFIKYNFLDLSRVLGLIEDMEAFISLANVGIVRDDICMPKSSKEVELKFTNLKHPLIRENISVGNSFSSKAFVNIITGSNMGGKTTFLRTVGINLLLMQAGTYVVADDMVASYLKIFTSMRIVDNIDKGISTFYGELLRVKSMVEYINSGKMLVLIDEIFKGTNFKDRLYGAKEVVHKLQNVNTIAIITTHDFELCDAVGVRNYYVKEFYEGDRIVFDYKIRRGKCSSGNAKYLMAKLGIIDK